MSEEQENKKVEVKSDGKATPTEETVEKIEQIQQADPSAQTTSEPSDAPAAELKEQAAPSENKDTASEGKEQTSSDAVKEERAKARAERAKARKAKEEEEEAAPKEPSPNQPKLDRIVQIMNEEVSEQAVEEAFINEMDDHLPCLVIRSDHWTKCAEVLKNHPELQLNYLRNVSGVDCETHLEVVYHLMALTTKDEYCVKVKTDREDPSIPSVVSIWSTADWNEREIYDLIGIHFPGHPDLRRIMMPDDWVGHPLRKDYEPIDPEV